MTKDIKGILWLSAAVFIFLCLYSYNPLDPSLNSISSNVDQVRNMCGIVGSFLSDALLQLFGMASWLFVLFFLRAAVLSFRGVEVTVTRAGVLIYLSLFATLSSICSLYLPTLHESKILVGGIVGLIVSEGLVNMLNPLGAGILLWTFFFVFVVFYNQTGLSFFVSFFKTAYKCLCLVVFNTLYFFGMTKLVFYLKQKLQKQDGPQSYSSLRGNYDTFTIEREEDVRVKSSYHAQSSGKLDIS